MEEKKKDVQSFGHVVKTAKKSGGSSGITLPLSWLGCRVCAVLLDDIGDTKNDKKKG